MIATGVVLMALGFADLRLTAPVFSFQFGWRQYADGLMFLVGLLLTLAGVFILLWRVAP